MQRIGRYEVLRALSEGGMAEAFLAKADGSGRLVVLKVPHTQGGELALRLRDEAALGARLFHPNLVETIELLEHEGRPVLVVGFVDGNTIAEVVDSGGPLAPAGVARVGRQIAEALSAVHGALDDDGRPMHALHRDVTARNVVVRTDGESVLIDLGIARAETARSAKTSTGIVVGTLRYLAPELTREEAPSPASDFWALGMVLFEAATGRPAFDGPMAHVVTQITTTHPLSVPAAAHIHPALRDVLGLMLNPNPKERICEAHLLSGRLRALESTLGDGQAALAMAVARFRAAMPDAAAAPGPPEHAAHTVHDAVRATPYTAPPAMVSAQLVIGRTEGMFGAAPAAARAAPPPAAQPPAPPPTLPPGRGGLSVLPVRSPVPARVDAPLELAVEPRRPRPIDTPIDEAHLRPAIKPDRRWMGALLQKVLTAAAVAVVLSVGWRMYAAKERHEARAIEDALEENKRRLLEQAMKDTPTAVPDCEADGNYIVYRNSKGTEVVVEHMSQVPRPFRASSRCVKVKR